MINIIPEVHHAVKSLNTKNGNNYDATVSNPINNEAEYLEKCKYIIGEDADLNAIFSETPLYSWSEVSTELNLLTTAYNNKEYQRTRAENYPSIQEQLDMQYWDNVNGTTTWKDAVAKVKSDNPKN